MALVLVATPGASDANTYCTLAEANTYHETRLFVTDWTGATDAVKNAALVWATRLLDDMYVWTGAATNQEQALQWPRMGMLSANRRSTIGDMTIPQELKDATAELARNLIAADPTADNSALTQGLSSFSAGPVSMSFKETFMKQTIPDSVDGMLPSWWGYSQDRGTGYVEVLRS